MDKLNFLTCTICGLQPFGKQGWFLVSEDRWRDKLRILHWDDGLATRDGIHSACSPEHLQELVVHWMTTGSLDHPFARSSSRIDIDGYHRRAGWTSKTDLGSAGCKPIGELSVHRESMQRVLSENPQSLRSILDALLSALQRETLRPEPKIDWDDEALRPAVHEV